MKSPPTKEIALFRGVAGAVHEDKETERKNEFHELYLHSGTIEYITPITFEDGMDWQECELYYACISNGTREHRSSFHLQRVTQIRRPSKKQLQQEVYGHLQSCLRTPSKPRKRPSHLELRRSISFSTIPKTDGAYSRYLSDGLNGLTSNGPHVNFDDYVSVSTIPLVEDYPLDVQKALWMSRAEIDACKQSAIREDALRRQLAQTRKRGHPRHTSKVVVAVADALDGPVRVHDFLYLQRT